MHRLKRVPQIVLVIYIILMAVLLVLSFVIPRPEARGLLRTAFSILLFPGLVFLALAILFRARRLSLALIPFAIAWIITYGPFLLPRNLQLLQDAYPLTVLTFNLQASTQNLNSLSTLIRDVNPDLVALQEVSYAAAEHFEETLGDLYPHLALYPMQDANFGQGVMSKFPILAEEYWRNEQLPEFLGHLRTEIDIEGETIAFFSLHPMPPISLTQGITLQSHSREIQILLDRLENEQYPVLLAGDFNMTHVMDEYHQVTRYYTDTFREAGRVGLGFSFPTGKTIPLPPVIRLDYIFHDARFEGRDAYPLQLSGVSDHLPMWAELGFFKDEEE